MTKQPPPTNPPPVISLTEIKRARASKEARSSSNPNLLNKLSAELDYRTDAIAVELDSLKGRIENMEKNIQAILDVLEILTKQS